MKDLGRTDRGEYIVIMRSEERDALIQLQVALMGATGSYGGPGHRLCNDMGDALDAIGQWATLRFNINDMKKQIERLEETMEP